MKACLGHWIQNKEINNCNCELWNCESNAELRDTMKKRSELCDKKLQLDFLFFIPLQGEKKLKLQDVNS